MVKKLKQNQSGFSVIIILLLIFVCVVIVGVYMRLGSNNSDLHNFNKSTSQSMKKLKVSEGEQTVTVDSQTIAELLSGATIDLQYFIFNPDAHNLGDVETNKFEHSPTFKVYHKGYLYTLSNYSCKNGQVTHDDYISNDRLSCTFTISTHKSSLPSLSSYDGIAFATSSQSKQTYDHSLKSVTTSDLKKSAYYDVEVPYMQFWGKGDGKYWGTSGNTLRVKTVYGIGTINFSENSFDNDVKSKVTKSVKVGPVTASVYMTNVNCYPPYLDSQNKCNPMIMTSGPYKGETVNTYNRVDYTLSFNETNQETADSLVLHY